MERLQQLLIDYNRSHESYETEWHRQFCEAPFPLYWKVVFDILSYQDRSLSVAEIGCGYGDVTAIPLYLGFDNVAAYERQASIASMASEKLKALFSRSVVMCADAAQVTSPCSILVMVNCVYVDACRSKHEYLQRIRSGYERFGRPSLFIFEAVEYASEDRRDAFPDFVWISPSDIAGAFSDASVRDVVTYHYPFNSSTKRIYEIERRI